MSTHVALLRGVNVGGRHKLPMATVRQVLDEASLGPVRTHIQSGNLLLHAAGGDDDLAARVTQLLSAAAGFPVPTVVVAARQLRTMVAQNPFRPAEPRMVHLVVLPSALSQPQAERLFTLRDELPGCDDLALGERCVYLHHPSGMASSKLAARAMASLPHGTARNLATMTSLVQLLE